LSYRSGCRHIPLEDNAILCNYLPLLREYIAPAAEEIESEMRAYAFGEGAFSYTYSLVFAVLSYDCTLLVSRQDAPERPIKITRRPFRFHNRAKNVKHLIHKVQSNL